MSIKPKGILFYSDKDKIQEILDYWIKSLKIEIKKVSVIEIKFIPAPMKQNVFLNLPTVYSDSGIEHHLIYYEADIDICDQECFIIKQLLRIGDFSLETIANLFQYNRESDFKWEEQIQ